MGGPPVTPNRRRDPLHDVGTGARRLHDREQAEQDGAAAMMFGMALHDDQWL